MTGALRPMTLGELLDRTFQLYRKHFIVFVGIAALPHLVVLGVQLVGMALQPATPRGALPTFSSILWTLFTIVVTLVVGTMTQAATVVGVSQFHLDRPIAIGQAFSAIRGRIGELCLITIGVGFLIGLGILLFIIPGVLLALRWALVIPVAVLERAGFSEARSRSTDLTDGSRGRVFAIYALYFILTMIVSSIWQIPIFVSAFSSAIAGHPPNTIPAWSQVLVIVGTFFTQCLVVPLLTIAISLLYYDQRVRKEAFDLDTMMASLDGPLGDSPATA